MKEVYPRIHYYRYLSDIKKYGQDYFTKRGINRENPYVTPTEILKNKAINENHIKEASIDFKIKQYPLKEIKSFLKENNLKISGKKEILAVRIIENVDKKTIDHFFIGEFYELTEDGLNFLENNKHMDFENWHWLKHIYEEIIPFEEYENSLGNLDALKDYILNVTLKEDASKQDWEKYCVHLDLLANVQKLDEDYCAMIKELLKIYLVNINIFAYDIFIIKKTIFFRLKGALKFYPISSDCLGRLFSEAYDSIDFSPNLSEEESYDFLNRFLEDYPYIQFDEFELKKSIENNYPNIQFVNSVFWEVLNKYDFKCCICGKSAKEAELDVGWQKSFVEEGNEDEGNLQSFCYDCIFDNGIKLYYDPIYEELFDENTF